MTGLRIRLDPHSDDPVRLDLDVNRNATAAVVSLAAGTAGAALALGGAR